jgi:hypothetical protein
MNFTPDSLLRATKVIKVDFATEKIKKMIQSDFPMKIGENIISYLKQDYLFRELFKSNSNKVRKAAKKNSLIIVIANVSPEEYKKIEKRLEKMIQNPHFFEAYLDIPKDTILRYQNGSRNAFNRLFSNEIKYNIQIFDYKDERELIFLFKSFNKKTKSSTKTYKQQADSMMSWRD